MHTPYSIMYTNGVSVCVLIVANATRTPIVTQPMLMPTA